MNFQQLLRILRARFRLILVITSATAIAAIVAGTVLPPRYSADVSLVVDFKGIDPITGAVLPAQLIPSYIATQVDIIQSQAVALRVVKTLKLADRPGLKERYLDATNGQGTIEDWLAKRLLKKLDVKPSRESRIMEVIFVDPDPDFAATVANAFARAYIQTNLELKVAPARESAAWFDTQLRQLREQFEETQTRLSKYQRDKGITSTDQKVDIETAKLSELSTQLVQVQAQVYENASRQKQLEEFISKHRNVDSLPEVLASPVIQDLKGRLSASEAKLNQAPSSIGTNHPDYQRLQSEVTTLRKKLSDEVQTAAAVIGNNLRITQSRERELRDAMAAQKARLLELNRNHDELGVLMKEVDNAQRAYEAASQRHTQTSLESRIDQSNVVVLNPAVAPIDPTFPNWPLVMALSVAVGLMLGMACALLAEMLDRRVRGADDLMDAIGLPVWGVLEDTASLTKPVVRKNRKALRRARFLGALPGGKLEKTI